MPGVLGRAASRFVGVPGAGGIAGGLVLTVVRVRASEDRAALNFLAEASGFNGPGVEERVDPVELEAERERLGVNKEVGRRRLFEPRDCILGWPLASGWGSVATLNRENFHGRDLIT